MKTWTFTITSFILIVFFFASIAITIRTGLAMNEDIRSFAKTKTCADLGSASARNACLGKNGQTPTTCPAGLVVCGATNSCLSPAACTSAGAQTSKTTPKPSKDTKLAQPKVVSQPTYTTNAITPVVQPTNNKCPSDLFICPCGCFSATQFLSANTDKCSDMCAPKPQVQTTPIPIVTPPPPAVAALTTTPIPLLTPYITAGPLLSSGTYYSQAAPSIADTNIPGENCTFIQVGCGEVTTANILTHAGIPTTPEQAAEQTKGGKCDGTTYSQNIAVLQNNGLQTTPYTGSFKNLSNYMAPGDSVWLSVQTDKSNLGHHTYIDGYTMVNGQPVYNLRDPFYGSDLKCTADGDRAFACSSPERSLHITASPDTNNDGSGQVAILVSPK